MAGSMSKSLNSPGPVVAEKSISAVKNRLSELHSGSIGAVPGDEVFKQLFSTFPEPGVLSFKAMENRTLAFYAFVFQHPNT